MLHLVLQLCLGHYSYYLWLLLWWLLNDLYFTLLHIWVLVSKSIFCFVLFVCSQFLPYFLTTAGLSSKTAYFTQRFVKKEKKMYLHFWGIRVAEEAAEVEWKPQVRDFWIGESPSPLPYSFNSQWLSSPWVSSWVPQIVQFPLHIFLHLCLDFPERALSASFPISTKSTQTAFLICLLFLLLFWKETLIIFLLKRHSVYVGLVSTSKGLSQRNRQRFVNWSIMVFWHFFF